LRCITCQKLSFGLICKECQNRLLKPTFIKRVSKSGLNVYSFYAYSEIKNLLLTKHQPIGAFVYKILAQNSFAVYKNELNLQAYLVPIDDNIDNGYSHTAILAHKLKTKNLKPLFGSLRAQNRLSYSGKSLDFRENNPRDFKYKGIKGADIILIDDIITTSSTISQAHEVIKKSGSNPIFALTLADAQY